MSKPETSMEKKKTSWDDASEDWKGNMGQRNTEASGAVYTLLFLFGRRNQRTEVQHDSWAREEFYIDSGRQ